MRAGAEEVEAPVTQEDFNNWGVTDYLEETWLLKGG